MTPSHGPSYETHTESFSAPRTYTARMAERSSLESGSAAAPLCDHSGDKSPMRNAPRETSVCRVTSHP